MTNPSPDCWIWTRNKNKGGYGRLQINGKALLVHRVAFALFNGPVFNGKVVCHRCDNPSCWNPKHLFVGTNLDNIRDCHKKGRAHNQVGENNNGRKLTALAVMAIRALYATGNYSQRNIANRFNVQQGTIYYILKNKTWRTNVNASK